jgi:hypothetical protein
MEQEPAIHNTNLHDGVAYSILLWLVLEENNVLRQIALWYNRDKTKRHEGKGGLSCIVLSCQ